MSLDVEFSAHASLVKGQILHKEIIVIIIIIITILTRNIEFLLKTYQVLKYLKKLRSVS
jgi:hypothetical protein